MHMMPAPSDLPGEDHGGMGAVHMDEIISEAKTPVDDGKGPKIPAPSLPSKTTSGVMSLATATTAPVFAGTSYVFGVAPVALVGAAPGTPDPNAGTTGYFDQPVQWPILGLHEILLPDGRVLNYGTDVKSQDTFYYDVWDPRRGDSSNAHNFLPNTTSTNIFCSFQSMDWQTGEVLITGGDSGVKFRTNVGVNAATIFSPQSNTLRSTSPMEYARWYDSVVDMPNGDMVTLGGYLNASTATIVPEVYNANATPNWRTLVGATSNDAFGLTQSGWFYPKAWISPRGDIFLIANTGKMYSIDPTGDGAITLYTQPNSTKPLLAARGTITMPTVMYAPGKLLSLRIVPPKSPNPTLPVVQVIDINGTVPVVRTTSNIDQLRYWATATVLADGRVAVTGGSTKANALENVDYITQIWDPSTEVWTAGAVAQKPRLYHSIAMLLSDGTVLTGAGGAPGPITERNAEIYYPPYLYLKDGSGQPAPRPTLLNAPTELPIGQTIAATVGDSDVIERVTLVRTGSVTHSTNIDQRFLDAAFTQSGSSLTISPPTDPNVFVPGYYLMFVFQNGTPSVATIIHVTPQVSIPSHPSVKTARPH
jgi:hypothetical protein